MKECPICKSKLEDRDNKCHVCGYILPYENKEIKEVIVEKKFENG